MAKKGKINPGRVAVAPRPAKNAKLRRVRKAPRDYAPRAGGSSNAFSA
jgi:hypothetical protein